VNLLAPARPAYDATPRDQVRASKALHKKLAENVDIKLSP
jgi:hypothetical protein